MRRATFLTERNWWSSPDFNPRSPCGERRKRLGVAGPATKISIHALLAESDCCRSSWRWGPRNFNPRSPCGERPVCGEITDTYRGISIHALLAESDQGALELVQPIVISIHALLAESDMADTPYSACSCVFQSTLSLRRATAVVGVFAWRRRISIHALLAESDTMLTRWTPKA